MRIKKAKHEKMIAKVDCQHKFETTVSKWRKILTLVVKKGCSEHVKNGLTCKDKWIPLQAISRRYLTSWQALDKIKITETRIPLRKK